MNIDSFRLLCDICTFVVTKYCNFHFVTCHGATSIISCWCKVPLVSGPCWLDGMEGHLACKKSWVLVCWWWWSDWSFTHFIAAVVTTTCVIVSSSKIQDGDIPVLAYLGYPGKWPLCHHIVVLSVILLPNCRSAPCSTIHMVPGGCLCLHKKSKWSTKFGLHYDLKVP